MKVKHKQYTLRQQGGAKEIQQAVNREAQNLNTDVSCGSGPWIGELIQILYEKGVLSKEDIFRMLPAYEEYDASKHK